MDFDWIILGASLTLLLLPASLLFPAAAKERLLGLHTSEFRFEKMLLTWQNWLDFGRALVGGYLLVNSAILLRIGAEHGPIPTAAIIGAVLVVAVLLQTIHFRRAFYFTAPIFFVWGVTFILAGWIPALFAIVFSTILTRLINHVELKFPLMAVVAGGVGFMLNGFSPNLALACAVIPIPLIVVYASMDTLLCYSRDLATK